MLYQVTDKNNDRLNRWLMGQFRRFLNDSTLKEIHLTDRLFTWSNERSHPTLERINRTFVSTNLEDIYPNCDLQALANSYSDHASLLLQIDTEHQFKKRFMFRSFWTCYNGFMDIV
jgi:hypothetical protein